MARPTFEELDVDLWVHPRKLGVTQPSVCLFHDRRDAGRQILDAIAELAAEPRPAQRELTFRACLRPSALEGLFLLKNALATWLGGVEDFGVSPGHSDLKPKAFGKLDKESGELWFWGPGYAGP